MANTWRLFVNCTPLARGHKNNQISTFTVADEESHPYAVQAKAVAEAIGARHQAIILTFEDYLAAIPGCVAALESPGGLFGVPIRGDRREKPLNIQLRSRDSINFRVTLFDALVTPNPTPVSILTNLVV
jgi:hypothetical protein